MNLTVTGLNHHQTGIDLREKLSFSPAELSEALRSLKEELQPQECLILSTCNRVEIYLVHAKPDVNVSGFLEKRKGVTKKEIEPRLYHHEGGEAARHLFHVVSSLDSMVVGENQILQQVKDAYQAASAQDLTGKILNRLFQQALHVGKRVRTETRIGNGGISIPSLAAKLAGKIFSELGSKTLLLLGAGETGRLSLEAFRNKGVTRILVANRTVDRAREISPEAFPLEQFPEILPEADIIVSCLSDQEFLITPDRIEEALRKRRREPMFFLDLAVPRNVHPDIKKLEDAYLFNIDDLEIMAEQNLQARKKEIQACKPIMKEELDIFLQEWGQLSLHQTIAHLHQSFHEIGEEELAKSLRRLEELDPEHLEEVRNLLRRTIGKLLHAPTSALKRETEGSHVMDLATRLFDLPHTPSPNSPGMERKSLPIK